MAHSISRIAFTQVYQRLPRALPPASSLKTSLVHRALSTVAQSEKGDQDRQRAFKGKSFVAGLLAGCFMTGFAVYAMNQKKENDKVHSYIKFMQDNMATVGPLGDRTKGQVEYTLDPEKIKEAMKLYPDRDVGICCKTPWHVVYNGVVLTGDKLGTQLRIIPQNHLKGGIVGSVALPWMADGTLLLEVNFRAGPMAYMLEVPRGFANTKMVAGKEKVESGAETAVRESREETGAKTSVTKAEQLGYYRSDTALTTGDVPIYSLPVGDIGETNRDKMEKGTMHLFAFTRHELDEAIKKGHVFVRIRGEIVKAETSDGFMLAALMLYDTHHPKTRATPPEGPVRGSSLEYPKEPFNPTGSLN